MYPIRLYQFVSQITKMITQAKDLDTLYYEACRIAVEAGKFKMAWIGIVDEATQDILPVAHAGDDSDYPHIIPYVSLRTDKVTGPTSAHIRLGKYFVCNDFEEDEHVKSWRKEALERGYKSAISLPIIKFGNVIGVFSIYTTQKNFFDKDEIELMEELGRDVTFAIENIEKEKLREAAEQSKIETERRHKTLTEILPVGVFYTTVNGYTTYVNKFWCTLSGLSFDEALGDGWLNAVHPDDKAQLIASWKDTQYYKKTSVSRYRFLRKDGTVAWVLGNVNPEYNALHEIVGFVGTITDVTENVLANDAIALREEKYKTIIENASDGIFLSDDTGRFLEVNNRAVSMVGYDNNELKTMSYHDLIVKEENYVPLRLNEILEGKSVIQKRTLQRKDGSHLICEVSAKLLPDGKILSIVRDFTDQMNIEKNLTIEKDLSDKIINSLPGIFYLSDTTPSLIRWNYLFEKISGYSSEELAILRPISFFDPQDHDNMLKAMHETYTKGNAEIEVKLLCKNGEKIPYYFTGVKIEYKGKPAMLGVGIDISDRIKAEKALKESEEKYRTLFQNANDAILITDNRGKFINVNPSACKLSQFAEEELYNMTIFDFAIATDLQKTPYHFAELKRGKTVITERVIQVRNGNIIDIQVTAKQLSDGRLIIFVSDISERKKAEREIINEKNLSDSIINSLPGIFYLFTKDGRYLRWNKNFITVSGYDESELPTKTPLDFIADDEKELITSAIATAFLQGENVIQSNFVNRAGNRIPYYFTGISINYNGEDCIAGVGIDFSDRIKVQKEIEETSEKLRELTVHLLNVREEERKRIGREIHDELGQQLTAIKMDISWIDKNLQVESPQIKTKMKNIIQLLDNSNVAIRRILNELRPYILDNYGLSESLHWLGRQFTEHSGIEVIYEADELESNISETISTSVFRIYQEALTNISKYAEANLVKTTLRLQNEQLYLTIADNGKGFDVNAYREKKFGLLGMKERVKSHGGVINIQSQPDKGTEISVKLFLNGE